MILVLSAPHDLDGDRIATIVHAQVTELPVVARLVPMDEAAAPMAVARSAAKEAQALGVLWVQPGADEVKLFVYEGRTDQAWVRAIPGRNAQEAVAVVARWTVQALVDVGAVVSMEPVQEPVTAPPAPAPAAALADTAAPPAATPKPRVFLETGVSRRGYAAERRWIDAVSLALRWLPTPRLGIGVGYAFAGATEVAAGALRTTIRHHPVSLFGGYAWAPASWSSVRLDAIVLGDPARRERASVGTTGLQPTDARAHWELTSGLVLRGELVLTWLLRLYAAAGLEVRLRRVDLRDTPTSGAALVRPWWVSPTGAIGLAVTL